MWVQPSGGWGMFFFCSSSKRPQLRHLRSFELCRRRLTCWERWTSRWWRAPTEPWWWGSGIQTPHSQCPWTWGYSRCTAWSVSADRQKEFTQRVCVRMCVGVIWTPVTRFDGAQMRRGGNSCRTPAPFPPCMRNQTISVRRRGRHTSPRGTLKSFQSLVLIVELTRPALWNVPADKTWLGGPRRQTGTTMWQRPPSLGPHILSGGKKNSKTMAVFVTEKRLKLEMQIIG